MEASVWELEMKLQKKDVWKSTKRKTERIKGAFIKVRGWGGSRTV